MRNWTKIVLLGAGLISVAGCTSRYYEDDGRSYYRSSDRGYRDYDRDYDRYYYRDRRDRERVRVCDADGSDCHWEYRRR